MDPSNEIRTMKTDIAEAIKEQNETLVSIALAEKRRQEEALRSDELARAEEIQSRAQKEYGAPNPRGRVLLVIIIIFILATGGIAFKFLLPRLRTVNIPSLPSFSFNTPPIATSSPAIVTEPTIVLAPSLVPAQSEKRLDTSKSNPEHIFALIMVERTAGLSIGDIENLYFTEESSAQEGRPLEAHSLSANDFLSFAGIFAPEIFTRSLETPFMAGFFGEEGGTTPFIILKVSSYETGLAGMLAWEEYLPYLFSTVFGMNIETQTIGKKSGFHNIVVLGRDARLSGTDPRRSISYAFADANTIVIAGSQNTLGKIMLMVAGE